MAFSYTYLSYPETNAFSKLVTDYLAGSDDLRPFYKYKPDSEGLREALADRYSHPVNRETLAATLKRQYEGLPIHDKVSANLELLQDKDTFTICTAHQPNLLTGYLYFIYKIVHVIRLADDLNVAYPDNRFVPVYYMGSEDNDLDELGRFRYNGEKYIWDGGGQTGAVGRMNTGSLKTLLQELFKKLGPPGGNCDELKRMLEQAYLGHDTIAAATRYLVNELFGRYGLVVLDPDDRALKEQFREVMKDDLLHHKPFEIATTQIAELSSHYKAQAFPRPVNLFYLKDNLRERIEELHGTWQVVGTDIRWDREQLLGELDAYPERFSPNVILRGLYQETILPNIVFIGGGAEVAYWLQLKDLFEHYNIFFPSIQLRQSVLWIHSKERKLREALGFAHKDIFRSENELVHDFVLSNTKSDLNTSTEQEAIAQAMEALKQKAISLDPSLGGSSEAVLVKVRYQLQVLERKMLRAEKKKMQTELLRISKLKELLFPGNGLQERVENFLAWYLYLGDGYIDLLYRYFDPLRSQFLIIEEDTV